MSAEPDSRWTAAHAARTAWGLWVIGLGLRLLQLWIVSRPDPSDSGTVGLDVATHLAAVVLGTTTSTVGAIIVSRRPGSLVGWLIVLAGLVQAVVGSSNAFAARALAGDAAAWVVAIAWLDGIILQTFPIAIVASVVAVFPGGRLPSRRWRFISVLLVGGVILRAAEVGLGADRLFLVPSIANPYQLGGELGRLIGASQALGVGLMLLASAAIAAATSLVARYRASSLEVRQQIRWIVAASPVAVTGAVPFAVASLVRGPQAEGTSWALTVLFLSANVVPIAILVAITRYRLYEIDRIINRAVLYGLLTAILAGVFTAGIALAQRAFVAVTGETSDAAIVITTLIVATLYAPLRKGLEATIDRRFKFEERRFGAYRDEVARVLAVVDPTRAAERLIREAVSELGIVGGAALDEHGRTVATAGAWPVVDGERVAIRGGGEVLHTLELGARPDGRRPDPRGVADLVEVAALVAAAVRVTAASPGAARATGRR